MKRPLIITIGIIIILAVLGVWVYLMVFGTPDKSGEVFTNLGFDLNNNRDVTVVDTVVDDKSEYNVDVSSGLQQLTTRPVAGFVATEAASSTLVRYAEQGTGHIYEIDLSTGEETLISKTTIPKVRKAFFSDDGLGVALVSNIGYEKDTFFAQINDQEQSLDYGESLVPNADNLNLNSSSSINYTVAEDTDLKGYRYNTMTGSQSEVFSLPFLQTIVNWTDYGTFAYNKVADGYRGYLYQMDSGSYKDTGITGYSLVVDFGQNGVSAYTKIENNNQVSEIHNLDTNETRTIPTTVIPEKCVLSEKTDWLLWCASAITSGGYTISDWYQGKNTAKDYLWVINGDVSEAVILNDLETTAGRPIDVTSLSINPSEDTLFFINKVDNTLWKFNF